MGVGLERTIVDEKKAQKLKILVLVVLGGLCLGLAVPRFFRQQPAGPPGKADGAPSSARSEKKDGETSPDRSGKADGKTPSVQPGKSDGGTPPARRDPIPWKVGPEIVRDPFSDPFTTAAEKTPPPPTNPLDGSSQDWSKRNFPWEDQANDIRPPVVVTGDDGLGTVHLPGAGGGSDTPPQVDAGPSYQLTGVISGEKTIAIIRGDASRYYAKAGDRLEGGYSVKSISRDRVTLSGPSGTQVLVIGRSR
jgi:hypothetical protein